MIAAAMAFNLVLYVVTIALLGAFGVHLDTLGYAIAGLGSGVGGVVLIMALDR